MEKYKMLNPIVEMDGDEMTKVIWQWTKELLLEPFIELKTEYYDLGLLNRDATKDKVTQEAAEACIRNKVAVKCATITPNADRIKEYNLHEKWKSPNATLRSILGGTIIRQPIAVPGMEYLFPSWKKPITIARHAYGDVYSNKEMYIDRPGKVELVFTPKDGGEIVRQQIFSFDNPGIVQGIHNKDDEIRFFAESSMQFALETKQDLWFASKDTISQVYDARFRDIFLTVYEEKYKEDFKKEGITYFYTLIDDAVARVMRSEGGFIWACKNYDGDVMSDMLSTIFGSLAMMTSILVSPKNAWEFEAAHGTVTRHFYKYTKGEETSTNPTATIFAWTGGLKKRAKLDGTPEIGAFAEKIEAAVISTIAEGYMTKDLVNLVKVSEKHIMNTRAFMEKIASKL